MTIGVAALVATAIALQPSPGLAGDNGARAVIASNGADDQFRVRVHLDAPPNAAARTWPFEIVDAAGNVVETVRVPVSGDAPAGTAAVTIADPGDYSVWPLPSPNIATDCGPGVTFSLKPLPSEPPAEADFHATPCPGW